MNILTKNTIQNIIIFLVSFFIYKKFGGTYFTVIPNLALMILIIIITVFSDSYKFIKSNQIIPVLIFLIMLLTSIFWTNAPVYGLTKILNLVITCIFFYIIYTTITKKFKLFFVTNILFSILYLLNLYFEFGSFMSLMQSLDLRFRLGMDMGESISTLHPISITRYLGFILLSIFIWFFIKKSNINNLFYFIILPVTIISLIYMFFSGTKAPILALILCIISFIVLSKLSKRIYSILFFSFGFLAFLTYINFDVKSTNLLTKDQKTYVEYRFFSSNKGLEDRSYQNTRALNAMDGKNLLFGSGSGDFAYYYNKKDMRDYPHNIFSEILYENGVFSLSILFYMFLFIMIRLYKTTDYISISYCIYFLYFLFNSMFSGDLISNNLVYGFFILAVLNYQNEQKEITI